MRAALDAFQIRGVQHNIPFLGAVLARQRFAEGRLTTNFLAEEFPDGFDGVSLDQDARRRIIAVAANVHSRIAARDGLTRIGGDWVVRIDRQNHPVTVRPDLSGVALGDVVLSVVSDWRIGDRLWTGTVAGVPMIVQIDPTGVGYRMIHGGAALDVLVLTPRAAELADLMPDKPLPDLSRFLLSPMPGLLVRLAVEPGMEVKAGQVLAVVEAMKMENVLRADADGKVAKIHAEHGASLAVDQPILEFA